MQKQPRSILFSCYIVMSAGIFGCQVPENKSDSLAAQTPLTAGQAEQPVEARGDIPEQRYTRPQLNAIRSAKQYLSISGFSRDGLINQLSSDAGDGYDLADATFAVDSLNADWNQEAIRSAKQYLEVSGFSCDGLIEQLSSSAGDKYTPSQASYGAQQAGACN